MRERARARSHAFDMAETEVGNDTATIFFIDLVDGVTVVTAIAIKVRNVSMQRHATPLTFTAFIVKSI